MKMKKIIAAIAAAAVSVSAMAVTAFAAQDASGLADGTAYLNLNKADWSEYTAEWTNAEITGDGSYTVSMTAADPVDFGQFNALEVVNGESKFGRTYVITIDSIKVNGTELTIGNSYTCSADGAGVTTRVNIYNEWNSPNTDADDNGVVDCRAADGDVMSKTAQVVTMDDLAGVTSLEVSFTVSGTGAGAADTAAADDTASDDAAAADDTAAEPAADTAATTPASTGNTASVVMLAVMAVAGTAAVASRKRK